MLRRFRIFRFSFVVSLFLLLAIWSEVPNKISALAAAAFGAKAWGYGADGELGDGNFYTGNPFGSLTPVQVKGIGGSGLLTGVVAVMAGAASNHSLALKSDGTVVAWGYGNYGQLGDGNFYTTGNQGSATPVQV